MGILRTVFVPNRTEKSGRDFCTGESVMQAKVWSEGYLTVREAAASCGSNGQMLHSHFFATDFIKPLALTTTCLIKREDVSKIANYFKTYTCLPWLARQYNFPLIKIVQLIEEGGIQPLKPEDQNFIKNRVTILRSEAQSIMIRHISKKYDTALQNEKPD